MNNGRRQKKRYGLLLILLVLNWLAVAWMVWKVDPKNIRDIIIPGVYLPMLVVAWGAFFFLFSVLFLSAKKALRWSLGVTFFLCLRFLGLGSTINGLLILGLLICVEVYGFKLRTKTVVEE